MTTISACLYAAQVIERSGLGERVDGLHDSADSLIYALRLAVHRATAIDAAVRSIQRVRGDPVILEHVRNACQAAGVEW